MKSKRHSHEWEQPQMEDVNWGYRMRRWLIALL